MATNNIKPFATSSSANILKDEELATRSELLTGFPYKSKADSKLVGKLMQNATAGAYAVGEFSAKYGATDITGSDATGFATAFESALQAYVNEKAPSPDLSIYATKENATLTGTATLNGQNVATVNQIPDTSHFVTDTTLADYPTSEMVEAEFSSYDKNIKAHIESELTGYASLTGASFSGAVTVQEPTAASNPATKGYVDSTYQPKGDYATTSALAAKADASALANYAPLANPAFTGTATLGGKNLVTADQIPDVSTKINISGSRGTLAGYETTSVGATALTVNQDSPDSQQLTAAVAITVSDGTANTAWVKKVSIKDAGVTISLGSAWSWAGGSQPTVTAPSLLILSWDNDCGIAILQTTGS